MDLLGAVTFLRENILDDVGGISSEWGDFSEDDTESFQLRWNNEELVANINEAINQVYRRILPVKELNPLYDITTSVGVQTYNLDPKILQIQGIRSQATNKTLVRVALEDVWDDTNLNTGQGVPACYIPNYDTGSISFYKIPEAVVSYSLLVYRLPLITHSWGDTSTPIELREEFMVPMLWYAAALSYEKDEANVVDPTRSAYFLQKFNQEFPMTSAYSDTRKRRTSNRSISYGGI